MRMTRPLPQFAGPVLWLSFLLLPAAGWAPLDGAPLRSLEIGMLAAAVLVWALGRQLPGNVWFPALLVALKIGAASVLVPQGFTARYYANAAWSPPYESSTEYPRRGFTRIDRTLQFDAPGGPHLPLFFFNDNTRFNYYRAEDPGRGELPFSIQWDAHLWVEERVQTTFILRGAELSAELFVDANRAVFKDTSAARAEAAATLEAGWRHVVVRVAAPEGRARSFEVRTTLTGEERPLGPALVYTRRLSRAGLLWDPVLRTLASILNATVMVALLWSAIIALASLVHRALRLKWQQWIRREAASLALAVGMVIAVTDALAFSRLVDGRLLLYSGGNDMLTYETFARDIVINGPLMLLGAPAGEASAFYFQPLYPYFLAAAHVLFGEDAFGVFFLQRLGVWVSLFAVASTARALFGDAAGATALAGGALFAYLRLLRWSSVLLAEVLFIPLTCLCLRQLVSLVQGGGHGRAIVTGVIGGIATLTRTTLLLAWPLVLPLVWIARWRAGATPHVIWVMAVTLLLVVSLASGRNWVASGQFVPLATSAPVVLLLGNPPPPGTPDASTHQHALFERLSVDDRTRQVLEGALHQPGAFGENLLRKALYTLGFFGAFIPGHGWSPPLVAAWIAAFVGLLGRRDAFSGEPGALAAWLPALLAAPHFAAVTIFVPHVYGDRMILPFYVFILPYVGAAGALAVTALAARVPMAPRPVPRAMAGSSRSSSAPGPE